MTTHPTNNSRMCATRIDDWKRMCRNAADNAVLDRLERDLATIPPRDIEQKVARIQQAADCLSGHTRHEETNR